MSGARRRRAWLLTWKGADPGLWRGKQGVGQRNGGLQQLLRQRGGGQLAQGCRLHLHVHGLLLGPDLHRLLLGPVLVGRRAAGGLHGRIGAHRRPYEERRRAGA